jgi:ElaB/YqjD/DUF883 family membrane-anchored ribosome-binding protein
MTQAAGRPRQQDGLKEQAADKVQDVASAAQEKASELREQGSGRLRDQFDQRSNQAGKQVRSLADALRSSGSQLSGEGNSGGARLAGEAADRVEQMGRYLEQKSGEDLMHDLEGFARRRPWMLAGIGMLAGMTAARILKASSDERYAQSRRTNGQWPARPDTTRRELEHGGSESFTAVTEDPLARDPYAGRT